MATEQQTPAQDLYDELVSKSEYDAEFEPKTMRSFARKLIAEKAHQDEKILDLAEQIQRRVAHVIELVQGDAHLNALGELQRSAQQFDQEIAVREALVTQMNHALFYATKAEAEAK